MRSATRSLRIVRARPKRRRRTLPIKPDKQSFYGRGRVDRGPESAFAIHPTTHAQPTCKAFELVIEKCFERCCAIKERFVEVEQDGVNHLATIGMRQQFAMTPVGSADGLADVRNWAKAVVAAIAALPLTK
jgi:hypothetical protein